MTDAMAAMLDELMGKQRNTADKDQQQQKLQFDEPEVCKHALAGLCPYTLFSNTKSDLGSCGMTVHEDHIEFPRLKEDYDALDASDKDRLGYERKLYHLLIDLVSEMDKRIARAKERVDKENQPRPIKPADQERLDALKLQEKESTDRAEILVTEGDADGGMAMAEAAEKFREEHDQLHAELTTPERTKSVCEVCGVFVNSTDNEQRRLDHINGKQYVGWKKIRDKLTDLEEKFARGGGPPPPDSNRERGMEAGDIDRHNHRSDDRHQDHRGSHERGHDDRRHGYGYDRGYDRERGYGDRSYNDRGNDRERGYGDREYGRGDRSGYGSRDKYADRYGGRGDRGHGGDDRSGSRGYEGRGYDSRGYESRGYDSRGYASRDGYRR